MAECGTDFFFRPIRAASFLMIWKTMMRRYFFPKLLINKVLEIQLYFHQVTVGEVKPDFLMARW